MLCGPNAFCDLAILESLGNEFNNNLLSLTGDAFSIPLVSEHSCLLYKRVASFTRLMPLLIPKRKKSRLKCAFTVRRAIFSCLAISVLSHPCSKSSVICFSRGPSRTTLSFIANTPSWNESRNQLLSKQASPCERNEPSLGVIPKTGCLSKSHSTHAATLPRIHRQKISTTSGCANGRSTVNTLVTA